MTFLLTPISDVFRWYDSYSYLEEIRKNLSRNTRNSLNKNYKNFIVFDYQMLGTTSNKINLALNKIYNKKTNYLFVPSVEDIGARICINSQNGTKLYPDVSKTERKKIIT